MGIETTNENTILGNLIITNKGYKSISNVKVGDRVYTHKGHFKNVTEILKKPYKGTIYTIKINGLYLPIKVIKDTPIWLYTGVKSQRNLGDFKWVLAQDITPKDMIVYPTSEYNKDHTNIKYAEFLGIFALCGYINNLGAIHLCTYDNEELKNTIISCLKKLDVTYKETIYGQDKCIYIKHKTLYNLCGVFEYKHSRSIPETIINSSIKFLKEFIKYFIIANRNNHERMYFRATSSLDLFLGYQRILFRLNSFSNIYKCLSRNNKFEYFAITLNKNELDSIGKSNDKVWFRNFHHAFLRIDEVSQEEFIGNIYHLVIEDDNSYCNHFMVLGTEISALS